MPNHLTRSLIAGSLSLLLFACANTTESSTPIAPQTTAALPQPASVVVPDVATSKSNSELTLKQIMADPDWLGRQPSRPSWSLDGDIVYARKREGSVVDDYFLIEAGKTGNGEKIELSQAHQYRYDEKVTSHDGQYTAWRFEDSVFVKMPDGAVVQLTRGGQHLRDLTFMTDNRLMARTGDSFIAFDLRTGQQSLLMSWKFADAPTANKPPKDFIAAEQQTLIQYIQVQRKNREDRFEHEAAMRTASPAVAPEPFYFPSGERLVAATLSPNGQHAIVVTTKQGSYRDKTDIMPHYIQEDGRIAAIDVRQRVADAKPVEETVWLVDLNAHSQHKLSYVNLPGYNDDVLADVKAENAAARGETYTVNRLPRAIGLLNSWYWSEPSVRWHQDGTAVALMLEAWDNKDRWIVTVDFDSKQFNTEHRLHDDAWVNYRYNQFGWLHNSHTLFYQSEHTGYSHLYVQTPGQAPRALTAGEYVVDEVTLTNDDQYVYFKANKKHPGIYEIYRVNVETGEHETLTELNGMTDYVLSPDEDALLLTHSKVTQPPELFLQTLTSGSAPVQLTNTVSEAFKALPWTAPQIVAIPSSHTDKPIYARVYLPEGYEQGKAKRAVVFNHGAGYLQNSHLGWSGYFREFMFHSLLVQKGYVVLDMDYRASAGYGRDWRTAIYRQMGTPEVEDLRDGVNWLVENANVDRQRIGTYGGSYGGFLTFMSMFNAPDLFQAGAALRPVSDWAHYNTAYTSNILNTPDVDPIAYRNSSPIYFAEGLEKTLLINAPMVDNNVFFVDVVRLVQRMIELEKTDFETAIYPVEPHGFVQPSSWLDEYRRIFKLFEENL